MRDICGIIPLAWTLRKNTSAYHFRYQNQGTMNRKEFIYKAAVITAGVTMAPKEMFGSNHERLVILHTNDWHSHIEPFPDTDKKYP